MPPEALPRWRCLAVALLLVFAIGLAGGAAFIWSGIYNVAASREHFAITNWILAQVRDQSIETHSALIARPRLEDPAKMRLGAAHYEGVCVSCHSRPGEPINSVAGQMLPPPPRLAASLADNPPEEIFWIVKHGLKYTGMPAWPTQKRDDEVWAVADFLWHLRAVGEKLDYDELAGITRLDTRSPADATMAGQGAVALTQCARCHDHTGASTHSALVPRLAGQSRDYLLRALSEYAAGKRASGIMQPIAEALSESDIDRFAAYYANLTSPAGSIAQADRNQVGRLLAETGDPQAGIPACLSCHGNRSSPQFPALAGQNAAYLRQQIEVLRNGGRQSTSYGQIMTVIARRLSAEQAEALASFFASMPADGAQAASDRSGLIKP